jgi:glycosyltransferase involved in cell wall biosynthesis
MRILFAITKGEVGGAQEHVRILARQLVGRGHSVGIVVTDPSPLADSSRSFGASVFGWPSVVGRVAPVADLRARRELRRVVRQFEPDVFHLHSSKAGAVGAGLLTPPKGVTVFTCHHAPFGPGRLWRHRVVARPVEHIALPRMHGIISDGVRDVPALLRVAPQVPIQVIPNSVSAPDEALSPANPRPAALWVARLAHPKDPLLAVTAWERVIERHPEATLVMCGAGPLGPALDARLMASKAAARIQRPGFVESLDGLYARSSLFVLPTRVEGGLTMATLEAMSHGLVPVVSDAGDAFLLDNLNCGVWVSKRGADAFANAVIRLLDHPDRIRHLRTNALRYVRSIWTVDDHCAETERFYEEVLDRHGIQPR